MQCMPFMVWKMVMNMIFSELYSIYYQTMAAILKAATDHPLEAKEMQHIVGKHAFGESLLHILPAIEEQRWQLITPDGTTPLHKEPAMPLTLLEKRWLKAIANDPRMRLFGDDIFDFPDVEPLFCQRIFLCLTDMQMAMITQMKHIFEIFASFWMPSNSSIR